MSAVCWGRPGVSVAYREGGAALLEDQALLEPGMRRRWEQGRHVSHAWRDQCVVTAGNRLNPDAGHMHQQPRFWECD